MLKKLSVKCTRMLIDYKLIEADQEELFNFAFLTGSETLLFILVCLVYAFVRDKVNLAVTFILTFGFLRSFSGGIHLKEYRRCLVLSLVTFICIIELPDCVSVPRFVALVIGIILIFIFYICFNTTHQITFGIKLLDAVISIILFCLYLIGERQMILVIDECIFITLFSWVLSLKRNM